MRHIATFILADALTKIAAPTSSNAGSSMAGGLFRGGLKATQSQGGLKGMSDLPTGIQRLSMFGKAFGSKAFRPAKNPFSAINPSELVRTARLRQMSKSAPSMGNTVMSNIRNSLGGGAAMAAPVAK
jgi:hypothetical protein